MQLTSNELGVAFFALNFKVDKNAKREQRVFGLADLKLASKLAEQLKECSKDEKFVDSELELDTKEKALLLQCLDMEWSAGDGIAVISLQSKLE